MAASAAMRPLMVAFLLSVLSVALITVVIKSMSSQPSPAVLFDVDGPSPRDPPRSAWAKAAHGTTYWMENKKARAPAHSPLPAHAPAQVGGKARGRADRPFSRFIRNAPKEVAEALHLPEERVEAMAAKYQSTFKAQAQHAEHRKGRRTPSLKEVEVELKDMSECHGKEDECDPLADNIVKVAEAIEEECFIHYFDEKEYYDCARKHASPLCNEANMEFPSMCAKYSYKTDHGWIGSEDPANVQGEFCQACYQIKTSGCFAVTETLSLWEGGETTVGALKVGDVVAAVPRDVDPSSLPKGHPSTVIFVHEHPTPVSTVTLSLQGGRTLTLTPSHPLPSLSSSSKGEMVLVPAGELKIGDRVLTVDNGVVEVESVEASGARVRYFVLNDDKLPSVSSVVSAAESSLLGATETAPFRLLHALALLPLPPVAAALSAVLDSPLLASSEALLHSFLALAPSSSPSPSLRGGLVGLASV